MGPDHYKVDVLHYINPHLIWIMVPKEGADNFYFEQIGLYGILPQNITFEVDCVLKTEHCEQWMPAAVLVMKKVLLDAAEVWFSPTYIDKKISFFDDNIHKYGDLIVVKKEGTQMNLTEEILNSQFAFEDECLFHNELRDGNLNTTLNYVTKLEILNYIEEAYQTRNIPKKIWCDALKSQTMVLYETRHLETTINARNLEISDRKNFETLLQNKLNDLKLCRDIDDDSAGRGYSLRNCRASKAINVGLKKKLELMKNKKTLNHTSVVNDDKDAADAELKLSVDALKDVPRDTEPFYEYKSSSNKDCEKNVSTKIGKKPQKKTEMNPTRLVAFGPAGLGTSKFNIKSKPTEENEEPVKIQPLKEDKRKQEKEIEDEVKQERDIYENADSEVNIRISNIDVLKKISAKSFILNNTVAKSNTVETNTVARSTTVETNPVAKSTTVETNPVAKSNTVETKKPSNARISKFKYLKDKMSKINDSFSSTSDKDSFINDLDSDTESITALEEKLGLRNNLNTKKDVNAKEEIDFEVDVKKPNVNPFKNVDGTISIFVDKLVSPILMVHTKKDNHIQPVSNMRDIPFGDDIHVVLKNMSIQKPMRPQTVSWPTILRGHSLFLIGPYLSGNTMGYLPAMCRLVSDFKNTHNHFGLSCIIVCATSHSVASVESACKMFLHHAKIFACYAGMSDIHITTSLLNGCDLLICTPSMLVRLIQEDFSLDFRNLSTFVVDDCEHISKVYPNELKFCLLKMMEIVKSRAMKEWKIQYIIVSRLWCDFMSSLAKKAPDSVICISAFEECVLYSKAATSVEFVMQGNKLDSVLNFLKSIDTSKKTVIVCRTDDEVQLLEKALTKLKYVVFASDSTMTVQDLYSLDKILRDYEEPVSGPILVCCDGNLTHLNVTDAHYLVHYSLPVLFSMFCKRFTVLIDNYPSIFKAEEGNIKIKILLDDNNIEQLPKILHFIKRCTNDVPAFLDEICTSVLSEKDLKKAQNLVPICRKLLSQGKCPDFWNCLERHAIFKEYDEPKAWLPREGTITFQILHYHSAVYYSARLTSCITKSSTEKYPQTYSLLSLKMGMYYSKEENRRLHGFPKIGDYCAVTLKQNLFVRCQVTKILSSKNNEPNLVLVKLIDEEKYEMARDTWLYYLPDHLKSIETHVVTVVLANLMPQDKDVTFSKLALNRLRRITEENDELYMRGQITMVVGNFIFVDTLEACQDLSSLEEIVVKSDFRKELLDGHAIPNPGHIDNLMKRSDYAVIESKEKVQQIVQVPKPFKILPKGRWAHLESDGFSSVFFMFAENPCEFFVRPIKFDKCLTTLIKDIKKYVTDNPEPVESINIGDIVLAEFPDDDTYERARIDGEVNNNKVKCFFVDQAEWREVGVKNILPITEKFITQLPFQAIECRLIGIQPVSDNWTDFSTNFFVDYCFDAGDKLKQLYTKYFSKEKAKFTEGHKYGVVLIDTYSDEDIIINQVMIDKNLAEENEEIEFLHDLDFQRKSSACSDSDSDIDEPKKAVTPADNKIIPFIGVKPSTRLLRSVPLVDSDDNFDDFEFVTDSSGNIGSIPLAEVVNIKEISETEANEVTSTSPKDSVRPPVEDNSSNIGSKSTAEVNIKDIPETESNEITSPLPKDTLSPPAKSPIVKSKNDNSSQVSKPKLLWRQNINTVTIKIKLIVDEYDIIIKERYIKFSADANDTKYAFDFELYGVVDLKNSSHSNKGQYIQVKLWKLMARNWLTLSRDSETKKWIVYDVENIDVTSDEETESDILDIRKQFTNTFYESESDDNLQDDISFSYKRE